MADSNSASWYKVTVSELILLINPMIHIATFLVPFSSTVSSLAPTTVILLTTSSYMARRLILRAIAEVKSLHLVS